MTTRPRLTMFATLGAPLLVLACSLACSGSSGPVEAPATDLPTDALTAEDAIPSGNGVTEQVLTVGGLRRELLFLVPSDRGTKSPLLIAFHGTSGTPTDWIDTDVDSDPVGLESVAAANHMVVAAPRARDWGEGFSDWDNHGGNDRYWETGFDANPARGHDPLANADLALVAAIIDAASQAYDVDPKRVYLVGFSNGGFFTSLAAFVLRDRIAAFAEADSGLVGCTSTGGCELRSSSTDCASILAAAASECPGCDGPGLPLDPPPDGHKVAGFLGHRSRDDVVSVVHTCRLDQRMRAAGYFTQTLLTAEESHGLPEGFLDQAIPFLLARRLP